MASDGRNLPVLAEPVPEARVIERAPVEPMPLSAPVAAATSGVLAGLAAMALVKAVGGRFRRRAARQHQARRQAGQDEDRADPRAFSSTFTS